jgi:leader peptidase (prepilin peptidase) / N-methyltransferase
LGYAAGMAALLGVIWGSFAAALVLRWARGEGLGGRSMCDHCGQMLRAGDLLPLLSYAARGGKSRCCARPIDPFHPWVEAAGGAIGVAAMLVMGGVAGWLWALMGWLLMPLVLLDARMQWLPDRLTLVLAAAGLLLAGPLMDSDMTQRWLGAAVGGLSLWLVRSAYRAVRGREGMGGGDPKLLAALGAWLGWQALPLTLLLASITGLIWAVIWGAVQHGKGTQPISPIMAQRVPFGVFLGVGGWMTAALFPLIFLS